VYTDVSTHADEVWRSLFSELLGFVFTVGAVGWLFRQHEQARREAILRRQRAVCAKQAERVMDTLQPVLAGGDALGRQYLPDLARVDRALDQLDGDCAEVMTIVVDEVRAQAWSEFRQIGRELRIAISAVQTLVVESVEGTTTAVPETTRELIAHWQESKNGLEFD